MSLEDVTVSLFRNSVPQFMEKTLERLYQRMHSSFAYHAIYGNIDPSTSSYVARKNGAAVMALLFRVESGTLFVLNEQLNLEAAEIERFCRYVFGMDSSIKRVSFPAIENKVQGLSFPFQQPPCTHNIVLALPESADAYLNSLGKSTRSYIKRYMGKLRRSFPSMSCSIHAGDEASEKDIRDIIGLNSMRMARRYKSSYIDHAETERIIKLVKMCGLVYIMKIEDRTCAGTINYRFGENYFLKVIAHDPAYDEYGLGTLCCYLTIGECIARKGKEYHFLWGRYEYKYRLLGMQRDLCHLVIYRSSLQLLRDGALALRLLGKGYAYKMSDWLQHKARRLDRSSAWSRLMFRFLNGIKRAKRIAIRLQAKRNGLMEQTVSLQKD